jgi:calcineurin-like phosphoesterase family protein
MAGQSGMVGSGSAQAETPRAAMIHFVADLHFDCDPSRHGPGHGLADNTEITRRICDVWRARVAPQDTVWILGNVGNAVHLAGLNGTKHLIRGTYDPQPWNCLATGRYASVSEARWLETEHGTLELVCDPARASSEVTGDLRVLHGFAHGQRSDWTRRGFLCVSAARTGWGPVSLDAIVRGEVALRQAA